MDQESGGGADPVAIVIERLLRKAQEAALDEDWDAVKDRAWRVLNSGAASEDAERQAHQFLGLADVDSMSPRASGLGPQSFSTPSIAGQRPTDRSPVPEPERAIGDAFRADKETLNVSSKMLRLFYSYVDADAEFREKLRASLAGLRRSTRSFQIQEWARDMIKFGEDRHEATERELGRADIILLLMSPAYLDQKPADDAEISSALFRHAMGTATVVPILLRSVELADDDDLKRLRALPPDGRPVSLWPDQDDAFSKIAEGIRQVCEDLASDMRPRRLATPLSGGKRNPLSDSAGN
jgi:TIR domain